MTTADGEELATVEQQKTLPEGSLDAGWSETADRAARPAARSIAFIIAADRAGNAPAAEGTGDPLLGLRRESRQP